jgi:hypothetical protein
MICVYRIPEKLVNGYCFNGPVPITFGNIDWMDTPPEQDATRDDVERFLRRKTYVSAAAPGTRFLVLCEERADLTFVIRV